MTEFTPVQIEHFQAALNALNEGGFIAAISIFPPPGTPPQPGAPPGLVTPFDEFPPDITAAITAYMEAAVAGTAPKTATVQRAKPGPKPKARR